MPKMVLRSQQEKKIYDGDNCQLSTINYQFPRILSKYDNTVYHFTENFIRVIFYFDSDSDATPQATPQVTPQATMQATMQATAQAEKVLEFCSEPRKRDEIQVFLGLKDREYFRKEILAPLIKSGKIVLTHPNKPRSPLQKYFTAQKFSKSTQQATPQAEKVLEFCSEPRRRDEIQAFLELKDREYFRKEILAPLIKAGKIALTHPDKPRSPNQRYFTLKKDNE